MGVTPVQGSDTSLWSSIKGYAKKTFDQVDKALEKVGIDITPEQNYEGASWCTSNNYYNGVENSGAVDGTTGAGTDSTDEDVSNERNVIGGRIPSVSEQVLRSAAPAGKKEGETGGEEDESGLEYLARGEETIDAGDSAGGEATVAARIVKGAEFVGNEPLTFNANQPIPQLSSGATDQRIQVRVQRTFSQPAAYCYVAMTADSVQMINGNRTDVGENRWGDDNSGVFMPYVDPDGDGPRTKECTPTEQQEDAGITGDMFDPPLPGTEHASEALSRCLANKDDFTGLPVNPFRRIPTFTSVFRLDGDGHLLDQPTPEGSLIAYSGIQLENGFPVFDENGHVIDDPAVDCTGLDLLFDSLGHWYAGGESPPVVQDEDGNPIPVDITYNVRLVSAGRE